MSTAIANLTPAGDAATKTASIKVSTVAPAQVPQYAYSPNTRMNVAAGLIFGAIIGMAIVVIRALTNKPRKFGRSRTRTDHDTSGR